MGLLNRILGTDDPRADGEFHLGEKLRSTRVKVQIQEGTVRGNFSIYKDGERHQTGLQYTNPDTEEVKTEKKQKLKKFLTITTLTPIVLGLLCYALNNSNNNTTTKTEQSPINTEQSPINNTNNINDNINDNISIIDLATTNYEPRDHSRENASTPQRGEIENITINYYQDNYPIDTIKNHNKAFIDALQVFIKENNSTKEEKDTINNVIALMKKYEGKPQRTRAILLERLRTREESNLAVKIAEYLSNNEIFKKFIVITKSNNVEVIDTTPPTPEEITAKAEKEIKEIIAPPKEQQPHPQNPGKFNPEEVRERIRDSIRNPPKIVLGNAISNRLGVLQGTQHSDFGVLEYVIGNLYSGTMTREQALNLINKKCSPETYNQIYNQITKEFSRQEDSEN